MKSEVSCLPWESTLLLAIMTMHFMESGFVQLHYCVLEALLKALMGQGPLPSMELSVRLGIWYSDHSSVIF